MIIEQQATDVVVVAPLDAEVVLDKTQARALTDEITTNLQRDWGLICRAYTERAWSALGYASWDAYCSTEFNSLSLRVPREELDGTVKSLRQRGLSTRAIASATGMSQSTIARAIGGESFDSPPPGGLVADSPGQTDRVAAAVARAEQSVFADNQETADCAAMAAASDDEFDAALAAARAQDDLSRSNVVDMCDRITSTDGKSHPSKKPKPASPATGSDEFIPPKRRMKRWPAAKVIGRICLSLSAAAFTIDEYGLDLLKGPDIPQDEAEAMIKEMDRSIAKIKQVRSILQKVT